MRKVTTFPGGRVAKWVILALWIALLVPALMLPRKVGDVEKHDSAPGLPRRAEATTGVTQTKRFRAPPASPAIVICKRPWGIASDAMAKAQADSEAFKGIKDVVGQPQGPLEAQDGKAIQ